MESQSHGFKFEDITIDFLFTRQDIIDAIQVWKKIGYTSIFDIPEYSYLVDFFGKDNPIISFTEEEYNSSLQLDVTLPISIKASKKSKSINKKIEFGDIQRTIKNFSLYDVKKFSIIIIEYSQTKDWKIIENSIVVNMNKKNTIIQDISKFAQSHLTLDKLNNTINDVKRLDRGVIDATKKKFLRTRIHNDLSLQNSLTGHVKIDSDKQRRVQCSIKRSDFLNSQTSIDKTNTQILDKYFKDNGTKIESAHRIRNKKK